MKFVIIFPIFLWLLKIKKKIFLPSSNCLLLNFFKNDGMSDIHLVFKDQTYLNSWNLFFFAETCDYVENTRPP